MNLFRMERLRTVLKHVRDAHLAFDLSTWIRGSSYYDAIGERTCGTAACACGYAALDPELQAEGLNLTIQMSDGKYRTLRTIREFNDAVREYNGSGTIEYEGKMGFDAADLFFDIDCRATSYLFDPDEYRDESNGFGDVTDVLERLAEVVDAGGHVPAGIMLACERPAEDDEEEETSED